MIAVEIVAEEILVRLALEDRPTADNWRLCLWREAGSTSEVIVRDMMDARFVARAEKFGIRSVPAVVINGKLASCCTGRGVDLEVLKNELGK